ncbi:MAG: hypothetical protein ACREOC_16700 [Gemmatimonadales bacterium]
MGREKAAVGVFISFEEPTRAMQAEAASHRFFDSPWSKHPCVQLRTIAELLDGKAVDHPRVAGANQTFKAAPRMVREHARLLMLDLGNGTDHGSPRKDRRRR